MTGALLAALPRTDTDRFAALAAGRLTLACIYTKQEQGWYCTDTDGVPMPPVGDLYARPQQAIDAALDWVPEAKGPTGRVA